MVKKYKKTFRKSRPRVNRKKKSIYTKRPSRAVSSAVKLYVKRKIAGACERKQATCPDIDNYPLLNVSAIGGAYQYFVQTLAQPFGLITQGPAQDQRIGNSITLKKWLLKFAFTPLLGTVEPYITSPQLFVDLYIGFRKDYATVSNPPAAFFQNGNSSMSPTGRITDRLEVINTDVYKILYRRRFKVGLAAPDATFAPYNGLSNNNFPMTYLLSVDMCKHGFKDAKIKYDDGATTPQNAKLNALSCWVLILNANGQPLVNTTSGFSTYDVSMSNNIFYLDA